MFGVVKWFNDAKGYGFITAEGRDYFIHFADIAMEGFKKLEEGDEVDFTPESSEKGPCAKEVVKMQ